MSLVADYSDSDEEEAPHKSNEDVADRQSDFKETKQLSNSGSGTEKDRKWLSVKDKGNNSNNFLLSGVGSGSSESESDDEVQTKKKKKQSGIKLDNPFRTLGGASNVSKEDSVFRNPFREKEEEKIAVLERHVKMTDNPETALTINGKKICWNYRKRKCYLGTKCPYAHDSDVPLTEEQLNEQKAEGDLHRSAGGNTNVNVNSTSSGMKNAFNAASNPKTHLPATASVVAGGYDSSAFFSSPHLSGSKNSDKQSSNATGEEINEQPYSKSKKRVGLTNSLIPPKKALHLYHKTKDT